MLVFSDVFKRSVKLDLHEFILFMVTMTKGQFHRNLKTNRKLLFLVCDTNVCGFLKIFLV